MGSATVLPSWLSLTGPSGVEEVHVLAGDLAQMLLVEEQHVVERLAPQAGDPPERRGRPHRGRRFQESLHISGIL